MATIEDGLRERLIALLRPRMTRVEAEMTVMALIGEVRQFAVDFATELMLERAELVAEIVAAAKDVVEALKGDDDGPLPVPDDSPDARVPGQ